MLHRFSNGFIFIILALIWGSSFILMRGGLAALTPYQVASLRIITAGLVLLPYAIKAYTIIPLSRIPLVLLSGTLGNLLPAYLFCIAEESIGSALAGVLNSLTPIFTLIIAFVFFASRTPFGKILGIIIAFSGTVLLFFNQPDASQSANAYPVLLIMLATLMYGTNVNLVSRYLADIPSLSVASVALVLNAVPALIIFGFSGFESISFKSREVWFSIGCAAVLGIIGTALATLLFYRLIQQAGIVFSSMVTYAIPIVAIFWGIYFDEEIGIGEMLSMMVILLGVYLANRKHNSAHFRKKVILKR